MPQVFGWTKGPVRLALRLPCSEVKHIRRKQLFESSLRLSLSQFSIGYPCVRVHCLCVHKDFGKHNVLYVTCAILYEFLSLHPEVESLDVDYNMEAQAVARKVLLNYYITRSGIKVPLRLS